MTLPWGDMPYDNKTPREVVDDYVLIRGDLVAEYARTQLAGWIERYAAQSARQIIRDDLAVLERVPCQFWACEGPDHEPVDMVTCFVCWRIRDLRALLTTTDA